MISYLGKMLNQDTQESVEISMGELLLRVL